MPSKRVLIITTSHSQMGDTGKKTGLWLEELSTPYYALKDAGLTVVMGLCIKKQQQRLEGGSGV